MNCSERLDATPDFLASDLSPTDELAFRAHLAECPACRADVEELLELWARLDLLPEEAPSPALRANFYARMEAYHADGATELRTATPWGSKGGHREQGEQAVPPFRAGTADPRFPRLSPLWKGAAAAGLLAAGTLVGLKLQRPVPPQPQSLAAEDIAQLRAQASYGLLSRPEATERLKGLALVNETKRPDPALLGTLLDTLEKDPSVNVRLAAVDALFFFADAPGVRERLLAVVSKDVSPLVQAALIDLLVGLREKRAAEALKRLAGNPEARPEVRARAQEGLQRLL